MSDRATQTRALILSAARRCFAQSGFAGSSLRAIAKVAGITQPLIHHYFASKEDLFQAVLEEAVRNYDEAQREQWKRTPGDKRFIILGLAVLFEWIGKNKELLRLMTWAGLEGRVTSPNQAQQKMFTKVYARFEKAQELGVLRGDVSISHSMMMIDALFKGYWDRAAAYSTFYGPLGPSSEVGNFFIECMIRALIAKEHQEELFALLAERRAEDHAPEA